jgi:hypothetical protein
MACYDTGDYTCTYDSGGAGSLPGGGDPDYSSLSTWESDTDNDLSGTGITILDCYDSQAHNEGSTLFSGATNTDTTHYRMIQSSNSCATPFTGKNATGANFEAVANTGNAFSIGENYFRLLNLVAKLTNDHGGGSAYYTVRITGWEAKVINCVIHDSSNLGVGLQTGGIYLDQDGTLAYNCIIYGCAYVGVYIDAYALQREAAAVCCTSCDNLYGFWGNESAIATDKAIAWSCYAADNATADFRDVAAEWSSPSGWNSSKDNTSDLGGTAGSNYKNGNDLITGGELDADYLPTQHIYWAGGAGDNAGRNPYNDLSASYDFADFFKNDTAGEDISKADIRGEDRPTPDTADVSWDIGAGEKAAILTPDECISLTECDSPTITAILTPDECISLTECDSPTIIATLTPDECISLTECDSPTITATLTPDECISLTECDSPVLLNLIITPDECISLTECDSPGSVKDILYVNSAYSITVCDSPVMMGNIIPDECYSITVCDEPQMGHIIIDWSIGSIAEKTLTANYTVILEFVGARDGQICTLALKQDGVGSRLIGLPSNVRGGPITLSVAAGDTDYIRTVYRKDEEMFDILKFTKGFN